MTRVKVVNAQVIDGAHRKQGEVIEVAPGRARDLRNDGKVTFVTDEPAASKPESPASKPVKPADEKAGK